MTEEIFEMREIYKVYYETINVKFINRKEKFIMLVERTNRLIIEVNDFKEYVFKKFGSEIFDSINEQELALFIKTFKIMDASMKVIEEQATAIQRIDEKLDELLDKKD